MHDGKQIRVNRVFDQCSTNYHCVRNSTNDENRGSTITRSNKWPYVNKKQFIQLLMEKLRGKIIVVLGSVVIITLFYYVLTSVPFWGYLLGVGIVVFQSTTGYKFVSDCVKWACQLFTILRLQSSQENTSRQVKDKLGANDDMMEMKDKLIEIKSKRDFEGLDTKSVHTVYGNVCLGAVDQKTVNQAEDVVLEICHNSIAFIEPTNESHWNVQRKVTLAFEDMNSFGVKVENAKKDTIMQNSIQLEFKCMSLKAVIDLIDYFYCQSFQKRLCDIVGDLRDMIGKKICISSVEIDRQSVLDVVNKLLNSPDVRENVASQMENAHNWTEFIQDFAGRAKKAFERKGLNGVKQCVTDNLDEWKSVPLNVAVIGSTGVGKSSFINTFLNLKADDEGAAKVNVEQCTMEPTEYTPKKFLNLKVWDLPGVGTKEFPQQTYLEQVKFERYDFFIFLTATRFTENDIWLAKSMHANNKDFYFVRTKIDLDIANFQVSHRYPIDEKKMREEIKKSCQKILIDEGLSDKHVYLVANYQPWKYDFSLLSTSLFKDAPDLKREAMAMAFSVSTECAIKAKAEVLKKRIHKVALRAALGSAIPLPGLGLVCDVASLIQEARHYRDVFDLTDENLQSVADGLQVPLQHLSASLGLKSTAIVLTTKGIATFCQSILLVEAVEDLAKFGIPIVGSFIAGAASFWSVGKCLETMLNLMVEDALKINQKIRELLESSPV